jgi:FkbM family methyltransferase
LRTLARAVIAGMPFKKQLLRAGASLPCSVKSRLFSHSLLLRVFSFLLFRLRTTAPFSIRTNLGISDDIDIELPSTLASPLNLVGTPKLYRGERGPLLLAQQLVRHCHAFVDVGAHIGYYTYFMKSRSRSDLDIYYFEPDLNFYDIIRRNLARIGARNVLGFNQAIGAASGRAEFFIDLDDRSMSSLLTEHASVHRLQATTVEVVTFDEFVRSAGLTGQYLVKVDIENAEWAFVEGARTALKSMPYLILEILGPARSRGLIDHLIQTFGFRCYYINGVTLEHMSADDQRYNPGEWNFLFCRESPEHLRERIGDSPLHVA